MTTEERVAVLETRVEAIESRFDRVDRLLGGILGTLIPGVLVAFANFYMEFVGVAP